jgi:CRP-like cAMP-binding protein
MRKYEILPVCTGLEYREFAEKEYLIKQGDDGDCMYIIMDGTVEVTKLDTRG